MTTVTSSPRIRAIILAEQPGTLSRENIVVTQSGTAVASGTVLTQSGDTGSGAFAMDAGTTGNPTAGTITVGAAAIAGAYSLEFLSATKFLVEDPKGVTLGVGTVGSAFSKGGLGFTLTAGGSAAVLGDTAKVTVAVGNLKYVPYQASGAAGPADAVLYSYLPAKTGDSKAVGIVRLAELNRLELTGVDAGAITDLAKRHLILRGNPSLPTVSTPAL